MGAINKQWFASRIWRQWAGAGWIPAFMAAIAGGITLAAQAAVIEFYNPDLNNYFITADPVEQAMIDTGAVGRWERTGNAFATGGPNQVCRFYGNANLNPATGTFFGPNSHFYTANPVECDGLKAQYTPSAKSWKFESNDFATTPAANGACPAGLVSVYRAYNNGFARGIDSNHRITSNHAAYLQTVAAGSIGEGVVMCAPAGNPPPTATAVGVASGAATTATIGAAGGSVSTADGRLALTIPAGALAGNTVIGIQPLSNTAHGKIGAAYQLTPPGQTFLVPITLKFSYADGDLAGTAAEFLGAAFQTAAGYWQWAGEATLDTGARTVSVASTHFSDWSLVRGLQIRPPKKTVKVNASVALQVKVCYPVDDGEVVTLASDCDTDQAIVPTLSVNEWSVNGVLGGGGPIGTVAGNGASAIYTAPGAVPNPNTVAVSARVHNPRRGPGARTLVVSNITVAEDSWTGTASSTSAAWNVAAEVTWTLESMSQNVATYRPAGTANLVYLVPGCSLTPSSGPIKPTGLLTVDYNTTPATYHGGGATSWTATLSCPPHPVTPAAVVTALFFGGSQGPLGTEAQGAVSADGTTIEGTDSMGATSLGWRFLRD